LVAKVIGDHSGIVEFETSEQGTEFRLRLPMHTDDPTDSQRSDKIARGFGE